MENHLSSVQRRLLQEQEVDLEPEVEPKAAPEPEAEPEAVPQEPEGGAEPSSDELDKVQNTIEAVKGLQDAAVAMEAARFALANEYSDFSLASRLERLKRELVVASGAAKDHIMKSTAKSPEAEELVAKWLKT